MNCSQRNFVATQCLYSLVLSAPKTQIWKSPGKLNTKGLKTIVDGSYDLADMMIKRSRKKVKE